MKRVTRAAVGTLLVLVLVLVVVVSSARAAEGDGAYGRLDGDLTIVAGLAGGMVVGDGRGVVGGELRARYLDAAGVFAAYEEADSLGRTSSPGGLRRSVATGVEIRPLFPVRFLKNMELGRSFADLVLDSLGIDLGVRWSVREGSAVRRPGVTLGGGVELPIGTQATGVWVRLAGAVRWSAPRLEGESDPGGRDVLMTIGLAWHQVVNAHLVDRRDRHAE